MRPSWAARKVLWSRIFRDSSYAKVSLPTETEGSGLAYLRTYTSSKYVTSACLEPCITVPMSKGQQIANQPPLEDALQATLEQVKNRT
jgi:hypothetical protein